MPSSRSPSTWSLRANTDTVPLVDGGAGDEGDALVEADGRRFHALFAEAGEKLDVGHGMVEATAKGAVHLDAARALLAGVGQRELHVGSSLAGIEALHRHVVGHVAEGIEVADGDRGRDADAAQRLVAAVDGDDRIVGACFCLMGEMGLVEVGSADERAGFHSSLELLPRTGGGFARIP